VTSKEFEAFLPVLGRAGIGDATLTIEQKRSAIDALGATLQVTEGSSFTPVDAGGVPAEWVDAPAATPEKGVLYLHGGGYTAGSVRSHRAIASALSEAIGARVLALGYRLAPESPFPAAVEDATTAYRWLAERIDPGSIAIGGDSAGGGLTISVMVVLRDDGESLPSVAFALSPWTDLAGTGKPVTTGPGRHVSDQAAYVRFLAGTYLNGKDPRHPLASPVYADLCGLPPLLVVAGSEEILFDDSARVVLTAQAAGTAAELRAWPGMVHAFPVFVGMFPEASEAIAAVAGFVNKHLGAAPVEA
jgi:epsilon-lactone hydrolase